MYCATARVPVTSLRLTNGHKNYYNYYHNYHYNFKLQFTSLVVVPTPSYSHFDAIPDHSEWLGPECWLKHTIPATDCNLLASTFQSRLATFRKAC